MGEQVIDKVEDVGVRGYLALPQTGEGPGVLLLHAWWGLNDFFRGLADRLAAEGFVVFAPDVYGDGSTASTIEEAERRLETLDADPGKGIERVQQGLDYLLRQRGTTGARVGLIGFSMGAGYGTWLAALRPEVAAIVVFYGGVEPGEEYPNRTQAAFLGHFAESDPYESSEAITEMESNLRSAEKEASFYVYPGTGHWFFEDDRADAYDAGAARAAWQRTVAFLHGKLG